MKAGQTKYVVTRTRRDSLWDYTVDGSRYTASGRMAAKRAATGVVHDVPSDVERVLLADVAALTAWEDLTPLARNEWICWVQEAKKEETRHKRIGRLRNDLKTGKRRPCCWPGCPHRVRSRGRPGGTNASR